MEYHHEVMLYIVENGPLPATKLATHFQWMDVTKRRWVQALRNWGWVTPKGILEANEAGRRAVSGMSTMQREEGGRS